MRSSQGFFSFALAVVLATGLAGCNEKRDPGFQGWVEADMIFVSPDEAGRVTKLDIREGDAVKVGDALYEVDDDLQLADLNQTKATLANAQQVFDRADSLRKTGSGTQATLDSAVSDLRVAQARVVTSQTRVDWRARLFGCGRQGWPFSSGRSQVECVSSISRDGCPTRRRTAPTRRRQSASAKR